MPSSNSASTERSSFQVLCYHNEVAPLRVVRYNGPTLGKKFYGCPNWPNGTCGFFRWANEVDVVRDLQFKCFEKDTEIADLEMQKELMDADLKRLNDIIVKKNKVVARLTMENTKLKYEAKAKGGRMLKFALMFSWIFFAVALLIKGTSTNDGDSNGLRVAGCSSLL